MPKGGDPSRHNGSSQSTGEDLQYGATNGEENIDILSHRDIWDD